MEHLGSGLPPLMHLINRAMARAMRLVQTRSVQDHNRELQVCVFKTHHEPTRICMSHHHSEICKAKVLAMRKRSQRQGAMTPQFTAKACRRWSFVPRSPNLVVLRVEDPWWRPCFLEAKEMDASRMPLSIPPLCPDANTTPTLTCVVCGIERKDIG